MIARALDPMLPEPYLVESVSKETRDTFTLVLKHQDPESYSPRFLPGQFSMLYLFGIGEVPISISGDPGDPTRLVYTVRSVGKATAAVVTRQPGESIAVRGPFGTSWPVAELKGKDIIIIAGGIGLAPLRPVIYEVVRHRQDYGRLIIIYGARTPKDLLYRKELMTWEKQHGAQVHITVDSGGQNWRGNVGVVTTLFRSVQFHRDRSAVMVCGPEIMMRFAVTSLEARGLKGSDIFVSMERNMKCAVGFCGHCQYGPFFICKDGPVFPYERVKSLWRHYEL